MRQGPFTQEHIHCHRKDKKQFQLFEVKKIEIHVLVCILGEWKELFFLRIILKKT